MRFDFFPLRFEFTARESLFFPPGKAANILRGALGIIFKRIACVRGCEDVRACETRPRACTRVRGNSILKSFNGWGYRPEG